MTTQQCVDYFAIILDKYGSPNLLDDEVVDFLNNATNEYLNRLVPDVEGGVANFEADKNVSANIRPLLYNLPTITTSGGVLTNASIDAALVTASGDSAATHFRIVSIAAGSVGYPVSYTRYNNFWRFQENYFKRASTTQPQYTQEATGYPVYPVDNTVPLVVTVIKRPRVLSLSPVVDPEWDDYTLFEIIAVALQIAGVSIRDTELIQDLRNTTVQAK